MIIWCACTVYCIYVCFFCSPVLLIIDFIFRNGMSIAPFICALI